MMTISWLERNRLLLVPVISLLATLGWTSIKAVRFPALEPAHPRASTQLYRSVANLEGPMPLKAVWSDPVAQSAGSAWIFDLFTPPEIYYDAVAQKFSVIPPGAADPAVVTPEVDDFGVELVAMRQEPYRLQLVGFVGDGSGAFGSFEKVSSTEHFLARAGRRVPDLGLVIEKFAVHRAAEGEWEASATVCDEIEQQRVLLSSRQRNEAGEWVARLRFRSGAAEIFELREGEQREKGVEIYRLESLRRDPAAAWITRVNRETNTKVTRTLLAP